jgi:hypothetical protein
MARLRTMCPPRQMSAERSGRPRHKRLAMRPILPGVLSLFRWLPHLIVPRALAALAPPLRSQLHPYPKQPKPRKPKSRLSRHLRRPRACRMQSRPPARRPHRPQSLAGLPPPNRSGGRRVSVLAMCAMRWAILVGRAQRENVASVAAAAILPSTALPGWVAATESRARQLRPAHPPWVTWEVKSHPSALPPPPAQVPCARIAGSAATPLAIAHSAGARARSIWCVAPPAASPATSSFRCGWPRRTLTRLRRTRIGWTWPRLASPPPSLGRSPSAATPA